MTDRIHETIDTGPMSRFQVVAVLICITLNMLDGFEGQLDELGHRGATGWRAEGLPWKQS